MRNEEEVHDQLKHDGENNSVTGSLHIRKKIMTSEYFKSLKLKKT